MVEATEFLRDGEEVFMAVRRNSAHLSYGVTVQRADRNGAPEGTPERGTIFSLSAACSIYLLALRMGQCAIVNLFPNGRL